MKIKIWGDKSTPAVLSAYNIVRGLGHKIVENGADLAVAPFLTEKISEKQLKEPFFGTLIFHPSPLPYGRGASSIRWAYRRKEPITAATWFWANDKLDAGDICEQEIIKIDYDLRPREFYEQHIIPAMMRTLERCLNSVQMGFKRKIKQVEEHATYDGKIE